MKKIRKLSKGMTLVEVIVAMTIFALSAACIMSVIGGAMKQANRSRKRDLETAQQANAVGKKSDVEMGTTTDEYTITFTPQDGVGVEKNVSEIKIYAADAAQFGAEFGFRIKTFTKGSLDTISTTIDTSRSEYKFEIANNLGERVTAYVTVNKGYVFEGGGTSGKYIHTSKSYVRTVESGSTADFGYYNDAYDSNDNIEIRFVTESNITLAATVNCRAFSTDKTVKFTLDNTSGSASLTTSYS